MVLNETIIARTDFLVMSNYPRDYRDCVRQAVDELVKDEDLYEMSQWYGDISRNEYAEDMCGAYSRFIKERIRKMQDSQ